MMKLTYVATITYNTGACDVKIVKAKDLTEAWQKVARRHLTGDVHIRSIELCIVVDDKDLR